MSTICASIDTTAYPWIRNWLSVGVSPEDLIETSIGAVSLYNRRDNADVASWLGDFEVTEAAVLASLITSLDWTRHV